MKRQLDLELTQLKEKILHMGGIAEEMTRLALDLVIQRNDSVAEEIFAKEETVNRMQMEIDDFCARIFALHQPEAIDLRTIISTMKINSELERVADQAVNMTQTGIYHLLKEAPPASMLELPRMGVLAQEMIKECLDAYVERNLDLSQKVLTKDKEQDVLKSKSINEIISLITLSPQNARQYIDLLLIAKNLEKIADHSTNIAEDVIYMLVGKDIRHHSITIPIETPTSS